MNVFKTPTLTIHSPEVPDVMLDHTISTYYHETTLFAIQKAPNHTSTTKSRNHNLP